MNRSPSFGTDSLLDLNIKTGVIKDALKIIDIRCIICTSGIMWFPLEISLFGWWVWPVDKARDDKVSLLSDHQTSNRAFQHRRQLLEDVSFTYHLALWPDLPMISSLWVLQHLLEYRFWFWSHALLHLIGHHIDWLVINQSNQSIHLSINQSINQSIDQSINQSIDRSINLLNGVCFVHLYRNKRRRYTNARKKSWNWWVCVKVRVGGMWGWFMLVAFLTTEGASAGDKEGKRAGGSRGSQHGTIHTLSLYM